MKILYLSHRIPYPPNKGDKIRSFNQVKFLGERHQLDLICLADEPGDMKYQADLEKLCQRVAVFPLNKTVAKVRGLASLACGKSISVGYFYQRNMQACFDRWLEERGYDAIVCFSSTMAEYIFRSRQPILEGSQKRPKLIMDFCDVDSDKWRQYASEARLPMKIIYGLEQRRLLAYEIQVNKCFDCSIFVTAQEADLFRGFFPAVRELAVIQNGVDFDYFKPANEPTPDAGSLGGGTARPTLVFTGAMDYHANVDGVTWFAKEIWPVLKQRFPDLQFFIVGSKPTQAVQSLGQLAGIEVTGFVDDIRDYYRIADVCVIPLRLARGVQNKALEAMAMGRAVITTSKANVGIRAKDNEHLLVADTPEEFIRNIALLLQDHQKGETLGKQARAFVTENFDWSRNMAKLDQLLN